MFTAMSWVIFGMCIWFLCIVLQAVQRRLAPEWGGQDQVEDAGMGSPFAKARERAYEQEIATLRQRVETLEAIVTDNRFQWERELNKD